MLQALLKENQQHARSRHCRAEALGRRAKGTAAGSGPFPNEVCMKPLNLCLLGFGNVGRALVELLLAKREEMRERYGVEWRITGVATRRLGWLAWPEGLDGAKLLSGDIPLPVPQPTNIDEWLSASHPDLLFEVTSLNPLTGEPAISHVRAALEMGSHVVTANKGPLAHAYHELRRLAGGRGRRFMFEATVAHCLPVFSLFRENLAASNLFSFSGILNSTTNIILEEMERGHSFGAAWSVLRHSASRRRIRVTTLMASTRQ